MRKKIMNVLECGGKSDAGMMMKLLYITPEYFVTNRSLTSVLHSLDNQVMRMDWSHV